MNFDSVPHPARVAHFIRETRETRGPGEQRTPSARAEYFAAKARTAGTTTTRTAPPARPAPSTAGRGRFAARDAADMRRLMAKRHVRLDAIAPRLARP
jgi:hypothetical protein